ncbi:endospore germination permease [Paenibacillus sp. NPDC056579]|uniref:GerAB/ArcD/ProY family transporter n=1 Tax=unclassified Paenibacillus TaxID=185978 RepID=UPI001EF9A93B|nr:endospore germination permease [Paenibacillus sp. H1-7]ULL14047.1 spore gernimation protein [Paenibacillus sp. H1-7]
MLENGKISIQQMAVLVIFVTIGDTILILPSITASAAKQDAWLSGVVGLLGGAFVVWLFLRLIGLKPNETIIQLNRSLLGTWLGGTMSVLFLLYYLFNLSAMTREISDFVTSQMMTETPIRAIHVMIIFVLFFSLRSGLESIGRAGELLIPWFSFFFIALFVLLLPQIETDKLLPIMGDGVRPVLTGSIYAVVYPFTETVIVFMMLMPYVKQGSHMRKDFMVASMIGAVCILAVVLISILILGAYITSHQIYPAYGLAKKISIGNFLERLEALLAIVWIMSTYFKCTLYLYALVMGSAQLLGLKERRFLDLPYALILFGLASLISPNISFYTDLLQHYWPFWDLTYAVAVPLLLLAVFYMRGMRKPS